MRMGWKKSIMKEVFVLKILEVIFIRSAFWNVPFAGHFLFQERIGEAVMPKWLYWLFCTW